MKKKKKMKVNKRLLNNITLKLLKYFDLSTNSFCSNAAIYRAEKQLKKP